MQITDQQLLEIQHLCRTLAVARNTLRAGGHGGSRLLHQRGGPTLQESLDSACIRAGNLHAELDRAIQAIEA